MLLQVYDLAIAVCILVQNDCRRQTLLEGLNNPYLIRAAGTAVIQLVYAIPLPNRSETELQ